MILWAKANRQIRSYPHLEAKLEIILVLGICKEKRMPKVKI